MSLAIFSPTPYINKWQMSLCNNSSDNKSYWIHRVDVKVSAQVTTVTYMHQSQPSLHSLRKHLTVHLELWPGNHFIWCNATLRVSLSFSFFLFYLCLSLFLTLITASGARCSSLVRAFIHGVMGHQIDPSWWSHWAISCSSKCSMTGVIKAVVCIILAVGWYI